MVIDSPLEISNVSSTVRDSYVAPEPDKVMMGELAFHVAQRRPFVYMMISLSQPSHDHHEGASLEWFLNADAQLEYACGGLAYSRTREAWAHQVGVGQYHLIVRGGLDEARKLAEELFGEIPSREDPTAPRGIVIAVQHNPQQTAEPTEDLADITLRLVTGVTTAYTRALNDSEKKYRKEAA